MPVGCVCVFCVCFSFVGVPLLGICGGSSKVRIVNMTHFGIETARPLKYGS